MKSILTIVSLLATLTWATASDSLPFPVTIGNQAVKPGEPFAKLPEPVAADASLEITSKPELIIINLTKAAADGTPEPGATPAVILLQGTTKGKLNQTMDQKKPAPGHYLMSVVAGGQTATIQLRIR